MHIFDDKHKSDGVNTSSLSSSSTTTTESNREFGLDNDLLLFTWKKEAPRWSSSHGLIIPSWMHDPTTATKQTAATAPQLAQDYDDRSGLRRNKCLRGFCHIANHNFSYNHKVKNAFARHHVL